MWRARLFIAGVVLESALLIFDRIAIIDDPRAPDARWYSGLMALNLVFFLGLSVSAVRTENKFELWAFMAASCLLTARVVFDFVAGQEKEMILAAVGAFQLFYVVLGYFLHDVMDRKFYHEVGTDVQLKAMYVANQRFWTMLKLDLQVMLMLLFTALFYSEEGSYGAGLVLAAAMCVLHVLWSAAGWCAVQRERVALLWCFFVAGLLSPAWIVVLLVRFGHHLHSDSVFAKLTVIGGVQLLARLATLATARHLRRHFGQGYHARLGEARARAELRRLQLVTQQRSARRLVVVVGAQPQPPVDARYQRLAGDV